MISPKDRPVVLYGKDLVDGLLDSPIAEAFEATIGAGRLPVRPPQSARAAFDKAAAGIPVALDDSERAALEEHGVRLADATGVVATLTGTTPAAPLYKALQPVAVTRSFVPASTDVY